MKHGETFYFAKPHVVDNPKKMLWFFVSPKFDEIIAKTKLEEKHAELLSLRISAFFDFSVGALQTENTGKIFYEWLSKNYSKDGITAKIDELREEYFTTYNDYITSCVSEENSKNDVLDAFEHLYNYINETHDRLRIELIGYNLKARSEYWILISESISLLNKKIINDLTEMGKDFPGFRTRLLQLDFDRRDINIFLNELVDPEIPLFYKYDRLDNVARMLWPYMQHREDYLKLHEILKANAELFKDSPDYHPLLNSLKSIIEYGNDSNFKFIKHFVNYCYNYEHDGKKLFYLENSSNSVVLNAKNDLFRMIYNPKVDKKRKFVLQGPTDLTHTFVHEFFTNPSINKASKDFLILSAIDLYETFFTRQGKLITKAAITRHLQRMKEPIPQAE